MIDLQWSETLREAEARALAHAYELQRREEARAAAKVAPTALPSSSRRVAFADDANGGGGGGGGGGGSGSKSDNAAVGSSSSSSGSNGGGSGGSGGSGSVVPHQAQPQLLTKPNYHHQAQTHTKAAHIIEAIATLRRTEREAVHALKQGRCPLGTGGDNGSYDGRPVRVAVYAESRRMLDQLGHFLYLRFGDDAVAQFWGKYRNSELTKFRTRRVQYWRCERCPPRAHHAGGREVEFPEVRCNGKHLVLQVGAEHAPVGMQLPAGATTFEVCVNEEDARVPGQPTFVAGTVWTVGTIAETRLRAPNAQHSAPSLGVWVPGRVVSFQKCGHRLGDRPWSSREVSATDEP